MGAGDRHQPGAFGQPGHDDHMDAAHLSEGRDAFVGLKHPALRIDVGDADQACGDKRGRPFEQDRRAAAGEEDGRDQGFAGHP